MEVLDDYMVATGRLLIEAWVDVEVLDELIGQNWDGNMGRCDLYGFSAFTLYSDDLVDKLLRINKSQLELQLVAGENKRQYVIPWHEPGFSMKFRVVRYGQKNIRRMRPQSFTLFKENDTVIMLSLYCNTDQQREEMMRLVMEAQEIIERDDNDELLVNFVE